MAHRVIWQLHNGFVAVDVDVDHINGVRTDNRIENLRAVTRAVNQRNQKLHKSNTSGIAGVCLVSPGGGTSQRWIARWYDTEGRRHEQGFSVNVYGGETARALAVAARGLAILELNNSGAGYSERHGT